MRRYVQQQQVTGYQAKENLYCVAQTLADEGAKVPFFSGKVITVYNFATAGMVNGPPKNTANETKLCARQPDPTYPAAIINAYVGPVALRCVGTPLEPTCSV